MRALLLTTRVRGVAADRCLTITVAAKNPIGLGPASALRVPA